LDGWVDGGNDADRVQQFPTTGVYSMRLGDNSGAESSMTLSLNINSCLNIHVTFACVVRNFEEGDEFRFELSSDNGSSWTSYGAFGPAVPEGPDSAQLAINSIAQWSAEIDVTSIESLKPNVMILQIHMRYSLMTWR